MVREAGRVLLDVAVGVGRAATPTPSGLYYVAELLRQPDPQRSLRSVGVRAVGPLVAC